MENFSAKVKPNVIPRHSIGSVSLHNESRAMGRWRDSSVFTFSEDLVIESRIFRNRGVYKIIQ